MRISDWSSDVCSSDLRASPRIRKQRTGGGKRMKYRAGIVLAAAMTVSACGINSVPTAEENVNARWADVQADYQRRANLIPNLVNTVKASVAAEDRVLTDVVNARARATAIQVHAEDLSTPPRCSNSR